MRLPIKISTAIRTRKLLPPKARVLVALSGGPDSVALLRILVELAKKRDLEFALAAAHLNHRIRGKAADRDVEFCRKLCKKLGVEFLEARCDTRKLAKHLRRSVEEAGRIARQQFLRSAALIKGCTHIAVAHHADDRIETVLYRICRGTGLAGLEGIGWSGPLPDDVPDEARAWIQWTQKGKPIDEPFVPRNTRTPEGLVRPLLGATREEILAYLKSKRQGFCTDETNFDTRIPRNAVRRLILPVLENSVHPGTRAALWRLAEEAEFHAERRAWRRGWLDGIAAVGTRGFLALPVPKVGSPPSPEELADIVNLLKTLWKNRALAVTAKHLQQLQGLFGPSGARREMHLPGKVVAERADGEVRIRRD
ncbi:MAG: tRNA lysidine(34) synthetase TilS [Planctomycetota bacterium]|nr:tRNA lysidine(34) synthetase TilS [Planctomycetota bacterium]